MGFIEDEETSSMAWKYWWPESLFQGGDIEQRRRKSVGGEGKSNRVYLGREYVGIMHSERVLDLSGGSKKTRPDRGICSNMKDTWYSLKNHGCLKRENHLGVLWTTMFFFQDILNQPSNQIANISSF